MTAYQYTGRSQQGEQIVGRLEGDSVSQIVNRLFAAGITPIDIGEVTNRQASFTALWRALGVGKPRTLDLLMFSRQMYTLTKAGVPLLRGLKGLQATTYNPVLREALADVVMGLEAGRDLAASLGRHPDLFQPLYLSLVQVGEATGTLDQAFLRLCDYLGMEQDVHDRVQSALRYPLMVIGAVFIAIGVISVKVIPAFAPVFRVLGDHIPLPTRIIMGISSFTQHYWWLMLGLGLITGIALRSYTRTPEGRFRWHRLKVHLPLIGSLIREAILARVARSLEICLGAGVPALEALTLIARTTGNDYVSEGLRRWRDTVERGESISRAAATERVFPPLVVQMIAVGEETGEIAPLLAEVADHYRRDVDYRLRNLSSVIEPALVVAVGGVVLVLALGVFLPMWEMFSRVGSRI
jgi:MSHA biogenesis protein MshG